MAGGRWAYELHLPYDQRTLILRHRPLNVELQLIWPGIFVAQVAFTEKAARFDFVDFLEILRLLVVEVTPFEQLFGPCSQAQIVVPEELFDDLTRFPTDEAFLRKTAFDVPHVLAISQFAGRQLLAIAAEVPGMPASVEAFVGAMALARPAVMPLMMLLPLASAHRFSRPVLLQLTRLRETAI